MSSTIIPNFAKILHGGDYCPEQWLGTPGVLERDAHLRRLSGCQTFSVGIFAWSALEPEEGHFEFDWLDRVMDSLAAEGCKAILATPSAARPPWLAKNYPEVMRVGRDGKREAYGKRHNFCWSSSVFREKVRTINTRLAERYKNHPALGMWHISNELAGHKENGECHCPLCLERWRQWLREKYGTLDVLNEAWWSAFWSHRYSSWDEIEPTDPTLDGMMLDWVRFTNFLIRDWYQFEAEVIRAITPEVAITTNFMGAHIFIDYARLAELVDVVADDQYPRYYHAKKSLNDDALANSFKNELYRCFKPHRPFFLMESCPETPQWGGAVPLKDEGLHRAEMFQSLGHGAEGTCYFQWRKGRGGLEKFHGAVVDHSGRDDTRTFRAVSRLSSDYEKLAAILGSRASAEVALLFDFEARLGYHLSNGVQDGAFKYIMTAQEHYRPFWRHGISVDVIDSSRDFSGYKLVIAPQLWMVRGDTSQRLADFVRHGGTLVATYNTAIVDESNRCLIGGWPGGGLMDVFGLWNEENDWLDEDAVRGIVTDPAWVPPLCERGTARRVAAVIHPTTARIVARYEGDFFYSGSAALTVNQFGAGQAWYLAAEVDRDLLESFYDAIRTQCGVTSPFPEGLPEGLMAQCRLAPDASYYFLESITPQETTVTLPAGVFTNMLDGSRVSGRITLGRYESVVLARASVC